MRLLKPNWVSHDGKPIFSVDIHPDGTRFATGGQGDNCGKVVVWNMAPVQNEKDEKDENVPKMLCMMDNHLACVNCVRWSNNGKYLASGGDDKVIMIWQTSRYAGPSAVFGAGGSMVNVEQWRCVSTLRGHSGDVLDLAWSPHDAWLASCSIDNTIVVWNAMKFPEQISVLRGHTGMVKGVTWDPVGKYLASQSDDKSLRVWRTLDWQQDTCITKPFEECGGTTHVLRLGWSPDGQYLVSAHAMNNSGPTAQIIEREGWNISMDFVGHRKAVTVVRFNPNILSKKLKKGSEKLQQYSCCAIGSRDRSLSIWLTALKRPLVVTHDLFTNSVLDATWSKNGFEMLCCSWDGTVAYFDLAPEEIGTPFTQEEKQTLHQRLYGKSLAISSTSHSNNQVIETTAMLKLQQQHKDKEKLEKDSSSHDGNSKPLVNGGTPVKHFTKQIETKTPDGRRRITPIFLAPQPDLGEAPLPFSNRGSQPTFSSSTERSKISVEKQDKVSGPTPTKIRSDSNSNKSLPWDKTPEQLQTAQTSSDGPYSEKQSSTTKVPDSKSEKLESRMFDSSPMQAISALATDVAKDKEKDKEKQKGAGASDRPAGRDPNKPRPRGRPPGSKKKLDLDGGPAKKRPMVTTPNQQHVQSVSAVESSRIIYATSGLELPTPSIDIVTSVQIYGTVGSESAVVLEIENEVPGTALHKVQCIRGGRPAWETILTSKVIAVAGNSHVSCVACQDQSVTLMSSQGRRLFPSMVLDSKVSILKCSGFYVMVITSKGSLFVWNVQSLSAVIKNESLTSIIANNDIKIETSLLTEQGLPVITLSTGKIYTFKVELGCWVLLACKDDLLFLCSDHQSCVSSQDAFKQHGPLATLQSYKQRPGSQAARMFRTKPVLQQASTLTHLENQVAATLALKSSQEYHFWLLTYVRYLAQEGLEAKLREVFDDLLGPVYKSKSSGKWEPTVLGVRKRSLLEEMLPFVGKNLALQRLFTEFQEQLDSIK